MDTSGRLASATSTGGVFGKLEGRVGDTRRLLKKAGTWADEYVAASCTGLGEFFILAGGAQDIASRVRYQGADLNQAKQGLIRDVGRQGGNGGVICLSRDGDIGFNTEFRRHETRRCWTNNPLFAATFLSRQLNGSWPANFFKNKPFRKLAKERQQPSTYSQFEVGRRGLHFLVRVGHEDFTSERTARCKLGGR
ncbi:MAG: isoaspartyl peptidase/L-asparaginase [Parvularculaceae bacterium]